jgi:DNA repair protein RadC
MVVTITLSDAAVPLYPVTGDKMGTPERLLPLLDPFRDRAQEHLVVITLTSRLTVLRVHTVTIGIVDSSLVHPREVFRPALLDNASQIILAHNHPSGDCSPSEADLDATTKLVEAGTVIGIPVRDHIIVGGETGYVSLKECRPELFRAL